MSGQRVFPFAQRLGRGGECAPLLFQFGDFLGMRCGLRLQRGPGLIDFFQAVGQLGGLGRLSADPALPVCLATVQLLLCFGQSTLATGQLVPTLVEFLHALLQFVQQGLLPLVGVRLPSFPLPLPLVQFLPPLGEFGRFFDQVVGLPSQVLVAAFGVRDVLLQLVRHLLELFGQRSFDPLDPAALGLQQLLRSFALFLQRAGKELAPLVGVGGVGEVIFHGGTVRAQRGSARSKHQHDRRVVPLGNRQDGVLLRITCYQCYRSEHLSGQKMVAHRWTGRNDGTKNEQCAGCDLPDLSPICRIGLRLAADRSSVIMEAVVSAVRDGGQRGILIRREQWFEHWHHVH